MFVDILAIFAFIVFFLAVILGTFFVIFGEF